MGGEGRNTKSRFGHVRKGLEGPRTIKCIQLSLIYLSAEIGKKPNITGIFLLTTCHVQLFNHQTSVF